MLLLLLAGAGGVLDVSRGSLGCCAVLVHCVVAMSGFQVFPSPDTGKWLSVLFVGDAAVCYGCVILVACRSL